METNEILVSRDAVFHEKVFPFSEENSSTQQATHNNSAVFSPVFPNSPGPYGAIELLQAPPPHWTGGVIMELTLDKRRCSIKRKLL